MDDQPTRQTGNEGGLMSMQEPMNLLIDDKDE